MAKLTAIEQNDLALDPQLSVEPFVIPIALKVQDELGIKFASQSQIDESYILAVEIHKVEVRLSDSSIWGMNVNDVFQIAAALVARKFLLTIKEPLDDLNNRHTFELQYMKMFDTLEHVLIARILAHKKKDEEEW